MEHERALPAAISVCLLAAAVFAGGPVRGQVSVALRVRARACGPVVALGDVARIGDDETGLAGVLLGAAPRPGDTRVISRGFVSSRLRQEGISLENVVFCGESRVVVLPRLSAAEASAEDMIAEGVRAHVAGELGCPENAVEVDLLSFGWIIRPAVAGPLRFVVSRRAGGSSLARAKYVLDCVDTATGRPAGRALAWTETVRYRAAVVSCRPVGRGEALDLEQLAAVIAPVREAGLRLLSRPRQASGREAARALEAGEPIDEGALLAPRLVRRGETVTALIETPKYRIASRARAMRSGVRGEVIPVENLGSRREFLARVVGESTVEVVH